MLKEPTHDPVFFTDYHYLAARVKADQQACIRFCALVPYTQIKKRTLVALRESMAACLHYLPLTSGLYD